MNTGFVQYKLPNNISLKQSISINNDDYVSVAHPLEHAIDGMDFTYCQLNGSNELPLNNAQIVITFDKEYSCNYLQVLFNNKVKTVDIYDYSNEEIGALMLSQKKSTKKAENFVNKDISAILLTNFTDTEQENIIQIISINVFSNVIEPPKGYYIKDIEIQSKQKEEE